MEKDPSQYSLLERTSTDGSDACIDSDYELAEFLHDSRKVSLRTKFISSWREPCTKFTSKWREFGPQSGSITRHVSKIVIALLPSYIGRRITGSPSQHTKLYPTSALDGLRGFACYFVFHFHLLFTYSNVCQFGYGFADNKWFHQLPFLRLIYAGPAMVSIFFVISGYVLSHKPLKLARTRSWDKVMRTMSSSVFRRALRLFLPTIIGTLITMLLVRAGIFKYGDQIRQDGETILGNNEEHPPYFGTFWEQFWDWQTSCWAMTDPWNWETYYNLYDPHLWTIPVEFRSSVVLFMTIVGLAKVRATLRLTILSGMIWYCILCDRWEVTLFLCGMFLAELDLVTGLFNQVDEKEAFCAKKSWRNPKRLTTILVFIAGLYLASSPNNGEGETPGYRFLTTLIPRWYSQKYRWWQSIGSILIVWSVNHSKDIQPLFTNTLAQYLGNISYAFYIVHGPILHSLGYAAMKTSWTYTGKETMTKYCLGFLMGFMVILPVVFWAADVFWRLVDTQCVKFARWLETKCSVSVD
jgi:peptidoglycan/LPS O-acetylase OafA/YrhL